MPLLPVGSGSGLHGRKQSAWRSMQVSCLPYARSARELEQARLKQNRKYITRFDYGTNNGWWVRIQQLKIGRYFSAAKYGGSRRALKLAIRFRDSLIKQYKLTYRPHSHHRTDPRSNTGIVGVQYCRHRRYSVYLDYVNGPYWTEYYRVTYVKAGKQRVRSFSIKKYGKRNAFRLAVKARNIGIGPS